MAPGAVASLRRRRDLLGPRRDREGAGGILESNRPEQAGEKLRAAAAAVAADEEELAWLERHLRPLAGLGEQGMSSPDEAAAAWRRYLEALAQREPFPWIEAVRASALGDYVEAAALLDRIGSLPDEAEARLRAGELLSARGRLDEAAEQLRRARAFYGSVGAAARLRPAEAGVPAR